MTKDWRQNEAAFNRWLFGNKVRLGIEHVGQIESWIRLVSGDYHFFEVKTQEPFEPPPFLGHGLPRWQVEKYLQMQAECNVTWDLVIFDAASYVGYRQRISVLEDGPYLDTHGDKPRRIYPLTSFARWTDDWRDTLCLLHDEEPEEGSPCPYCGRPLPKRAN